MLNIGSLTHELDGEHTLKSTEEHNSCGTMDQVSNR